MTSVSLKVLHIVPTYAPAFRYGGTIISTHGLCKALTAMGHQVFVCTTNVDGENDMDFPPNQVVNRDGVKVRYFPVAKKLQRLSRRLYYSPDMRNWLRNNIKNYDLVHLHSVFLWPTNAAARIAYEAGVPYVLAPRGMLVNDLIAKKNSLLKKCWIKLIESKTIRRASLLHFTSQRELSDAQQLFSMLKRFCVIPNGVNINNMRTDQGIVHNSAKSAVQHSHTAQQSAYLLYLGRINWKKGLDVLLKAIAQSKVLQSKGSGIKLLIAGNDEEAYQSQLEKLASNLGVLHQVEFIGFIEGSAKQQLLANAECLMLCSANENFGNVVLESLVQATPVIVTTGVGASSIVAEHQVGFVVENTSHDIAQAIDKMLSEPETAKTMGQRGSELVIQEYTWSSIGQKIVTQYNKLLAVDAEDV